MPVEGVLSPNNCVLNQRYHERSEGERGGSPGLCLWRGC